jgi:hypothetical protein
MKPLLVLFIVFASAASGTELFLAVGPGGQRLFSADGVHWEKHTAWGEPKHDQNDLNVAAFYKGIAWKNNETLPKRGNVCSIVRAGETLFRWSRPATKIHHSRDAVNWQPFSKEDGRHVIHAAHGSFRDDGGSPAATIFKISRRS